MIVDIQAKRAYDLYLYFSIHRSGRDSISSDRMLVQILEATDNGLVVRHIYIIVSMLTLLLFTSNVATHPLIGHLCLQNATTSSGRITTDTSSHPFDTTFELTDVSLVRYLAF